MIAYDVAQRTRELGVRLALGSSVGRVLRLIVTGGLRLVAVGVVAGWLAGRLVKGGGFGVIGDLVVGVIGAVIGGWLFRTLGASAGGGLLGSIIVATIGAVVLLFAVRVISAYSLGPGTNGPPAVDHAVDRLHPVAVSTHHPQVLRPSWQFRQWTATAKCGPGRPTIKRARERLRTVSTVRLLAVACSSESNGLANVSTDDARHQHRRQRAQAFTPNPAISDRPVFRILQRFAP
jgi:uncharacterized membrane protein YeaQ/YmgE (transglycosylase-associated protein family)